MKGYSLLIKMGIILCIVLILLFILNWFTGAINTRVTKGASTIGIGGLFVALYYFTNILKAKNKKQ